MAEALRSLAGHIDFFFLEPAGELHRLGGEVGGSDLLTDATGHLADAVARSGLEIHPDIIEREASGQQGEPLSRGGDEKQPEGTQMLDFDDVWRRIVANQGSEFQTTTGLPFTYDIDGTVLHPSRTNYNIPKSQVAKAFELVPFDGPGAINSTVRGPSYVWAILHDPRIRGSSW